MAYRAFNGGMSFQNMPDDYVPEEGEVMFDHPPTRDELSASFYGYAEAIAEKDAAEAAAAALDAAMTSGCAIVSSATPALNGTYAIDQASQQAVSSIAGTIASRNRLPGGGSTFNYPDKDGEPHAFTKANFLNFANAIEDYVYALQNGSTPAQPVTIA